MVQGHAVILAFALRSCGARSSVLACVRGATREISCGWCVLFVLVYVWCYVCCCSTVLGAEQRRDAAASPSEDVWLSQQRLLLRSRLRAVRILHVRVSLSVLSEWRAVHPCVRSCC